MADLAGKGAVVSRDLAGIVNPKGYRITRSWNIYGGARIASSVCRWGQGQRHCHQYQKIFAGAI